MLLVGSDIFVIIIVFLAVLDGFSRRQDGAAGLQLDGRAVRPLHPHAAARTEPDRPFVDRIGRKMNVMEQVIDVPEQEVITKDNATVTVDCIAFFQVFDAAKASYEVASLEQAIVKLTMTNIRSVMGAMDLDQMLSHRDEINERLLRVVDAAVSPWGIKVNRIEIKDIVPPADLIQSMGRQMKAERDKRAEILTAEGQRQSAILKAEGAKQAQILEAEGRREAAFRDAEARERSAAGGGQGDRGGEPGALPSGNVAALNYFVADKYLRALTEIARSPNQKVLMLPIEVTGVLGSLAGIAEIAKATFGGGADGGGAGPVRQCAARSRAGGRPARAAGLPGAVALAAAVVLSAKPFGMRAPCSTSSTPLGIWGWFIAGGVLLILEVLAPGVFMLWLGLAALLVGLISLGGRLALAGAVRRLCGVLGRRHPAVAAAGANVEAPTDQPFLNRRAEALSAASSPWKSRSSTATAPSAIDDTVWRITGADTAGRQPGQGHPRRRHRAARRARGGVTRAKKNGNNPPRQRTESDLCS